MNDTIFDSFLCSAKALGASDDILDGDELIIPPSDDYGYESTPENALVFSAMGVDGVHSAVLQIDGNVADNSPVVMICPMDSDDIFVIAETFIQYLAVGCGVDESKILELADQEQETAGTLASFLTTHFRANFLDDEDRIERLNKKYLHLLKHSV